MPFEWLAGARIARTVIGLMCLTGINLKAERCVEEIFSATFHWINALAEHRNRVAGIVCTPQFLEERLLDGGCRLSARISRRRLESRFPTVFCVIAASESFARKRAKRGSYRMCR
jgi:hypothetical protein